MKNKLRQKMLLFANGFTLIELMIVIAIIAIVAAIAIPNLSAARKGANETSAVASLRTLSSAQTIYREGEEPPSEPPKCPPQGKFGTLEDLYGCSLIDELLRNGAKDGYFFTLEVAPDGQSYTMGATPANGNSGRREFYYSTVFDEIRIRGTASDAGDVAVPELYPLPPDDTLPPVGTPTPAEEDAAMQLADSADLALRSLLRIDGMGLQTGVRNILSLPVKIELILLELDANGDLFLTFDEVLNADVLGVARAIKDAFVGGDTGGSIGSDGELIGVTGSYLGSVDGQLEIGIANEGVPPPVPIDSMTGDPLLLVDQIVASLVPVAVSIGNSSWFVIALAAGFLVLLRKSNRERKSYRRP